MVTKRQAFSALIEIHSAHVCGTPQRQYIGAALVLLDEVEAVFIEDGKVGRNDNSLCTDDGMTCDDFFRRVGENFGVFKNREIAGTLNSKPPDNWWFLGVIIF